MRAGVRFFARLGAFLTGPTRKKGGKKESGGNETIKKKGANEKGRGNRGSGKNKRSGQKRGTRKERLESVEGKLRDSAMKRVFDLAVGRKI